jgi:hypothetical protein
MDARWTCRFIGMMGIFRAAERKCVPLHCASRHVGTDVSNQLHKTLRNLREVLQTLFLSVLEVATFRRKFDILQLKTDCQLTLLQYVGLLYLSYLST